MADNKLYYGDNLDILQRYVGDQTVDLVYLDPPFNSNQDYNVLFKEQDGERSAAQVKAFKDTWQWDTEASRAYQSMVEHGPEAVSNALRAFHTFLGFSDMLAYLSMMAPRLVELHRVLKETGSIYLHCDPTASHYLKMLMDAIFGPTQFRNEVIWQRTRVAKKQSGYFGKVHDVMLLYTKSDNAPFNAQFTPHPDSYIRSHYCYTEEETGRAYGLWDFTQKGDGPPRRFGDVELAPPSGKHWIWSQERIDAAMKEGRIVFTSKGTPRLKRYLDVSQGEYIQDIWADVYDVNAVAKERLGYPTQKPEALLDRIIRASSNEGELILDPFCGCGTTVAVAQRLNRRWIGIDITCLAINLMRRRLETAFGGKAAFEVIGEPTAYAEAKQLAGENPYQFQWWALDLVGARPVVEKKGADKGIDGRLLFHDDTSGEAKQVIFQVKAGHITAAHVRDLRGVLEREGAQIACLISLEDATQPMRAEAAGAGNYQHPLGTGLYPRLQLITVKDLLEGKKLLLPEGRIDVTFAKAPKAKAKQRALGDA